MDENVDFRNKSWFFGTCHYLCYYIKGNESLKERRISSHLLSKFKGTVDILGSKELYIYIYFEMSFHYIYGE